MTDNEHEIKTLALKWLDEALALLAPPYPDELCDMVVRLKQAQIKSRCANELVAKIESLREMTIRSVQVNGRSHR